jgi:glycosyltransferase A (GT-A) superfamily protein (DUF2064 family)
MHATENEETNEHPPSRERAQRRAVESVPLSEQSAGARVNEVVRQHIADGSQRVVITHADRELPREFVEHAFDALRYSGLVCAPDGAGDIALLGMTQAHDALIAEIPWGSGNALDELLRAARERHVSVMLLPPLERSATE